VKCVVVLELQLYAELQTCKHYSSCTSSCADACVAAAVTVHYALLLLLLLCTESIRTAVTECLQAPRLHLVILERCVTL
jgi:hypothetical protein